MTWWWTLNMLKVITTWICTIYGTLYRLQLQSIRHIPLLRVCLRLFIPCLAFSLNLTSITFMVTLWTNFWMQVHFFSWLKSSMLFVIVYIYFLTTHFKMLILGTFQDHNRVRFGQNRVRFGQNRSSGV